MDKDQVINEKVQEYSKYLLSTNRGDKNKAIEAVKKMYTLINAASGSNHDPDSIQYHFVASTEAMNKLFKELGGQGSPIFMSGYFELWWAAQVDAEINVLDPSRRSEELQGIDLGKTEVKKCNDLIKVITGLAENSFGFVLGTKNAIIVDKPTFISLDDELRFSNWNRPALEFSDGFKHYLIEGRPVPDYIVDTKPEDITRDMILKEKDIDYRRILGQKVGNERLEELMEAETVDSLTHPMGGEYSLINIDHDGTGEGRPYLKMYNPSVEGAIHIEGVTKGTKSVIRAHMDRLGFKEDVPESEFEWGEYIS